jgi:hypothetical protein
MLDPNRPSRAHTPGALRARASRARLRDGIRTFKVRAHTRRLIFAMRRANPELSDELDHAAIEAELTAIVAAFVERWLGKKPCA